MDDHSRMSAEEFKVALPAHMRGAVTDELLIMINKTITDVDAMEVYKENILGFTSVLRSGKYRMDQYLNAVRYVSFKLLGDSNRAAWAKTFPAKFKRYALMVNPVPDKDINSLISRYNKSKLVVLIYELTLVPTHILNAPLYQQAINVQADLMTNARSEKVRCDAAANLIMHLKPPEAQKIELDIAFKEDETIKSLRASTMDLVRQQQEMIKSGTASVAGIAGSKLVSGNILPIEEGQISGVSVS